MPIRRLTTLVSVITLAGGATALLAQGKTKTVATVPATLTFRCGADTGPSEGPCGLETDGQATAGADRLRDDGAGYGGTVGDVSFFYRSYGTRPLRLFLGSPLPDSIECDGALAGCNPDLAADAGNVAYDGSETRLDDFEVQIKPIDLGTLENRVGGLVALPCGVEFPALVHITVRMAAVEGHWGLNYNARAYHSEFATVERTGDYTWTVDTRANNSEDVGDTAELVAFNHRGITRRAGPSHEGWFAVPFSATIDSLGRLPTRSTRCS